MEVIDKINNALEYIEENITGEIDYNQITRRVCCSVYHFERMFSYFTGVSLSQYIRRRRLTLAAFDLREGAKVMDVAVKYNYNSPEAFSRAFKNMHGVMPTIVRNTDVPLKAYPKLSFNLSVDGDMEINYRIVENKSYNVCGIIKDIPRAPGESNTTITEFWSNNIANGVIGQFHQDIGLPYETALNAALFNFRPNVFSYMICYDSPTYNIPDCYTALSVPPLTWAVFSTPEHPGSETTSLVKHIRKRISQEWFPISGFIPAKGPEFELFKRRGRLYIVEIWIPIIKSI